jgi:hypothetical protein
MSTPIKRATVLAAVAAAAAGAFVVAADTASATALTTITAVSPHLAPATTAKTVITVTGTGFDEDVISGVTVGGCTNDPAYTVVNATTLVLKTDATCAATSTANAVITITDIGGGTATNGSTTAASPAAAAFKFVTPPDIADTTTSVHPAFTDATAGLTYAQQTTSGLSVSTAGGSMIRVYSGQVPFATSTTLPFSASLDGVPLTGVTIGGGTAAGNYFTGIVGAHAADAAPTLKITNNGVTKSFAHHAVGASTGTQELSYGGSTVSVSPSSGPAKGGTVITVTGTGFSTTASSDVVTVDGVSCPVTGTPTATSVKCTVPASTLSPVEGPVVVQIAVTGGLTSVVSAGSTFTYLAQ